MTSGLDIRTRDLQRLCAVIEQAHAPESCQALPHSALAALAELVPCDEITYSVMDPARQTHLDNQDLHGDLPCLEPDEERLNAFFWNTFWSSPACSYPQRTGDFRSVVRATDCYSPRELAASQLGELFRVYGMRYETIVPLTPNGGVDHRIIFWRADGPDFSDRDQLILTLLRPHLAESERARRNHRGEAALTSRQTQLLDLVATGMTNRQIARRLDLSEGTVRRHLENIFGRLGVNSRAAAVAHRTRTAEPASRNPRTLQPTGKREVVALSV